MERAPRKINIRGDESPKPAETQPEVSETYSIDAQCSNCDWKGKAEIPKGVPVKVGDPLDVMATCPECGCTTLVRVAKAPPVTTGLPSVGRDYEEELRRMIREAQPYTPPVSYPPPITTPFVPPYTPPPITPWTSPHSPTWIGTSPSTGWTIWNTNTSTTAGTYSSYNDAVRFAKEAANDLALTHGLSTGPISMSSRSLSPAAVDQAMLQMADVGTISRSQLAAHFDIR